MEIRIAHFALAAASAGVGGNVIMESHHSISKAAKLRKTAPQSHLISDHTYTQKKSSACLIAGNISEYQYTTFNFYKHPKNQSLAFQQK